MLLKYFLFNIPIALSDALTCKQTPYLTELLVSWILAFAALPLCAWVLWHVRETNYDLEDVKRIDTIGQDRTGDEELATSVSIEKVPEKLLDTVEKTPGDVKDIKV